MTEPLVRRIPFTKIVVILAVTFGIGFGMCGLSAFVAGAMHSSRSAGNFLAIVMIIDAGVIVLSAIGLVLTVIVWVILSIIGRSSVNQSAPPTLNDSPHRDSNKPDDHQ